MRTLPISRPSEYVVTIGARTRSRPKLNQDIAIVRHCTIYEELFGALRNLLPVN